MSDYPPEVAAIVDDYLARMEEHVEGVPVSEREDFVQEIRSHLYEAFQREPGDDDDLNKIRAVLRHFGDPAEVVYDRLPQSMVRSGRARLPLALGIGIGVGGFVLLFWVVIPSTFQFLFG